MRVRGRVVRVPLVGPQTDTAQEVEGAAESSECSQQLTEPRPTTASTQLTCPSNHGDNV